ncbi:hypothetical protein ACSFBX_34090 [Variovorax sp. RB2P76]|uniref:hypothetical protein n=1 Tax=Variovorax sp. RB2P76 TaxID=3443736 RepID=UPI003F45A21C
MEGSICSAAKWWAGLYVRRYRIEKSITQDAWGRIARCSVYALFLQAKDLTEWVPKYVGKSARTYLRSRISNHLIGKHERTGSKLDEVRQAVLAGRKIGISYILVEPEELRGYVEEKLIPLVEGWNHHAAKKR